MTTLERRRNNARGGDITRFEPYDLNLANTEPTIRASFEQVGCIIFFEKYQGHNKQVAREFA
jgi:hypothetical protein